MYQLPKPRQEKQNTLLIHFGLEICAFISVTEFSWDLQTSKALELLGVQNESSLGNIALPYGTSIKRQSVALKGYRGPYQREEHSMAGSRE